MTRDELNPGSDAQNAHLDEKEKGNITRIEFECNIAHPTSSVRVTPSDKSHTFRNVADDR